MPFQRFPETMKYSIYDFKNAQLLDFHIATAQLHPWKIPEAFSVLVPI